MESIKLTDAQTRLTILVPADKITGILQPSAEEKIRGKGDKLYDVGGWVDVEGGERLIPVAENWEEIDRTREATIRAWNVYIDDDGPHRDK